jgi:hypothetical protein
MNREKERDANANLACEGANITFASVPCQTAVMFLSLLPATFRFHGSLFPVWAQSSFSLSIALIGFSYPP